MTPERAHEYAVSILAQLALPLPDCYKDAQEFLWDFWPDMPWTPTPSTLVARTILADENLRFIVRAFDARHGLEGDVAIETGMMVYACQNFD